MQRVALIINPGYMGRHSKTGELDESLHVSRAWIGSCLLQHRRRRQTDLWTFDLAQMRRRFLLVVAALGLSHLKLVLYCARHSGASIDRLEGRLPLNEVRGRGRWRTESSVRRYEKRAMVQKVAASLSGVQKKAALRDQIQLPSSLAKALA